MTDQTVLAPSPSAADRAVLDRSRARAARAAALFVAERGTLPWAVKAPEQPQRALYAVA